MGEVRRWPAEAWVPLLVGLYWLWWAPQHGFLGFLFSVVPGCLLVGSGFSMLTMPGDRRIPQLTALGGLLGVVFALPAFLVIGFGHGLLLLAGSAATFLAAGLHSLRVELPVAGVPAPPASLACAAQVAVDEALLATMQGTLPLPSGRDNQRVQEEVRGAHELFEARGWLEKPADYHRSPPALAAPHLRTRRVRNLEFEHLSFESEYAPHPDEPGGQRFVDYAPNRVAHAWVLRHEGPPRPWLVCVHGFQMGEPILDMFAFPPEYFHQRLGLNLLFPVLPLHGPRKIGRRSGDGFIGGDILDTVHCEAQAMWDMRRLLSWVREEQGAPAVGAIGLSLGGYNVSLLACLEPELACVVAGIPLADFSRAIYRHGPPLHLANAEFHGVTRETVRSVARVISPLDLEPAVPLERRYIFGGTGDRLVTPDQVRDLWLHWQKPAIVWYPGGHITFRAHGPVRRMVRGALRDSGLAA